MITRNKISNVKTERVDITIIADKFSPNTCSDGSGGFWEPFLLPEDSLAQSNKWCKDTWDYLMSLVKSPTAAALGVHTVSGYNFTGVNIPKRWSVYTTMMINVKKYLPWLMRQFRIKNGKVINRKINSLEEVMADYDLVVNCTGIGAYDLGDSSVYPAQRSSSNTGGTSQRGNWSTDVTVSDRKRILDGCSRLIPSLQEAEVLEEWTGLRPSRPTIRLEKEDVCFNGRTVTIIHNYGHAGSGITLFWGCAKVATDFAMESYRLNQQSKL
ncbi:DAO [Mytilus edulis]|uniref:DAO n=1 Tax=Mytilus edulis TaxID=6550 RepID=A0A8S3T191_MYTED|nr:DAO [Mytilus edulis]